MQSKMTKTLQQNTNKTKQEVLLHQPRVLLLLLSWLRRNADAPDRQRGRGRNHKQMQQRWMWRRRRTQMQHLRAHPPPLLPQHPSGNIRNERTGKMTLGDLSGMGTNGWREDEEEAESIGRMHCDSGHTQFHAECVEWTRAQFEESKKDRWTCAMCTQKQQQHQQQQQPQQQG